MIQHMKVSIHHIYRMKTKPNTITSTDAEKTSEKFHSKAAPQRRP